jgi:hypothetical protein
VDYWCWKDIVINVVCVLRQGGKVGYDASWVEKLQRGVARNLSIPHQFVCLSDCDVPCERIALEPSGKGFWSKVQLFRPGLFVGPVLYLDLDTVICNSIDPIVERIQHQEFVMWYEADKHIHSSAFMWWQKDQSHLWQLYQQHTPDHWAAMYSEPPLYGDQAFVSERVAHTLLTDHCPSNWFHIASRRDIDNLPDIKLLMFRKTSQKPSTMLSHPLVQAHWL